MTSADSLEGTEAILANLAQSLRPEENTYTVTPVSIPMPDGIELAADLYTPELPADTKTNGLIYVLGPYGRGVTMAILNAKCFAARGYQVLFASCRGTGGSGGTFEAAMTEQADSQAVVKWMRGQPWYPGKFAIFGASYLGYVQWALLRDPPEDLITSINLCSVYDHSLLTWTNGAYRLERIFWAYMIARQNDVAKSGLASILDFRKVKATLESTPLIEGTRKFLEGRASHVLESMATPDTDAPFWARSKHAAALEVVNIPILLRSGWYDHLTDQTLGAYTRLRDRGCEVYLTVGPWTHSHACGFEMEEVFDFLDEFVVGKKKNHRPDRTKIYVTGAEEWRSLPAWPPATQERVFYLHGDKTISSQAPPADSPTASFTFDPHNPTPTMGGPRLSRGGRVDDSAYASRSDVVVYTSAPLTEELELMGRPVVELTHSTDIPYADLWIRLSEVDADGVSHNLTEGWHALDSMERPGGVFSLSLTDRAHVFHKGTSIRVIVAGGSFPLFARNSGTGVNRTEAKELKSVEHTVRHAGGISRITLPCSV
ncbi:hydrolase [Thozetella sp. PMI_491]|nr:hydrolase [Thozetella sp. PMI_491]